MVSKNIVTIGGGSNNEASETGTTIGGGMSNKASGGYATIPGGNRNTASGANSFAAGYRAKATNDGSFVWADSQNADYPSNGVDTFNIRAAGGVYYSDGVANIKKWDIAEFMDVLAAERVEEADSVSLVGEDLLGKSKQAYDDNLIGVVSSKRTATLHLGATEQELKSERKLKEGIRRVPISLVGRVYVKVANEGGPIKLGDPITSSSRPGIGMKATRSGKIIGYALQEESFKVKDAAEILVFVNSGYYLSSLDYVGEQTYAQLLKEVKFLKEELEKFKK